MKKVFSKNCVDFIDDDAISALIERTKEDPVKVREIIAKSMNKEPLTVEETASLIAAESPELRIRSEIRLPTTATEPKLSGTDTSAVPNARLAYRVPGLPLNRLLEIR